MVRRKIRPSPRTGKLVLASIGRSRSRWILLLLVIAALAAGIGLRDPSPPDEPRFALSARTMIESGDWLVPHRGQELYAEKPPVFMWLQAASYTLVRDWRVAFLLPSLLAAMATLWLTWDLARRLWSPRAGWYAAAALWVCIQFGLQAKRGQIDMVLVALTTLSLWALIRHLLIQPSRPLLWLGAFAAGVGTVTKGVGFLPLLVLLPWFGLYVLKPTSLRSIPGQPWLEVIIAFLAGTAVWIGPLAVTLALDPDPELVAYARELLLKQTATRYADAWHHVQPWWYYLQVIATLWLPGSLLLCWLLPAWIRRLRRADPRFVLLLSWAALVLLFFSMSPGKREVYIFPALPALCVAAASLLPALLRKTGVQRVLLGYLVGLSALLLLAGFFAVAGWSDWARDLASEREIAPSDMRTVLFWVMGLGASGVGLVLAALSRRIRTGTAIVAFTGGLWIAYGLGFAPAIDASSSAQQIMHKASRRLEPGAELGLIAWREQHLLQAQGPVTEFGFKRPWHEQWASATRWVAEPSTNRWLFVLDEAMSPCVDRSVSIEIGRSNRRDWWLVPGAAVRGDCVTPPLADASNGFPTPPQGG